MQKREEDRRKTAEKRAALTRGNLAVNRKQLQKKKTVKSSEKKGNKEARVQTSIKKVVSVHKTLRPAKKESKGDIGSDSETDSETGSEVNSKSTALTSTKFRPSEAYQHSPGSAEKKAEKDITRRKDRANKKHGLIYKFTHRASGRGYIGLTRQKFRKRIQGHLQKANNNVSSGCRKLCAAIRKYGWGAFDKECLYENVPIHLLGGMEIVMIANHNTRAQNGGVGGFNLTDGGDEGGFCDPEVQARAQEKAKPAQKVAFASAKFKTKVGKVSKAIWNALTPVEHQARAQKQVNGRRPEFVRRREAKIASLPNDDAGRYYWQHQKDTCLNRIRRRMQNYPERFIGMNPIKDCEEWFGPSFEARRRE
jgi:hypothetical protein